MEGMAAFQKGAFGSDLETLALMNSSFAGHVINLLNPTIHFGAREVHDLPYPVTQYITSEPITNLVERAIALARARSLGDETTYEFVAPPAWPSGAGDVTARARELAEVERQIDEEVYHLYEISAEDRQAIE